MRDSGTDATLAVAVDLTPLQPGGSPDDFTQALFQVLSETMEQAAQTLVFLFLTNSATRDEVRHLARPQDLLICMEDPPSPSAPAAPREFLLPHPPSDFLRWIGADLLYAPFGACTFTCADVPTVALIADLLHRDYPLSLSPAQIVERESSIAQTLPCASMIQCPSRAGVERLIAHYQVPEEKLFYTYLPARERWDADPAFPDFFQAQGIAAPYFFYPADLRKHKNHETLLLAYRLYREQAGEAAWDLVLAFPEDKRAAELRALARALGIEPHLHCLESVPQEKRRAFGRHAGALVFPSLHEDFGFPLLEALRDGVPIVTGPEVCLKEIAGDAAYYLDPRKPESIARALLKISTDPAVRASLSCRGQQRLGFFDGKIEARKLLEVWKALAARKEGFPRIAEVFEEEAALALPTPASDALWTLEVRVNPRFPQNRYSFYLDDAMVGSFSIARNDGKPVFHWDCRPCSRTLRVWISRDRTVAGHPPLGRRGAIEAVVAHNPAGPCFPLFEQKEEGAL